MFSFQNSTNLSLSEAHLILQKLGTVDPTKKQVVFDSSDTDSIPDLLRKVDQVAEQITAKADEFDANEVEVAVKGLNRLRAAACDIDEILIISKARLTLECAQAALKKNIPIEITPLTSREIKWARVEGRFDPPSFLKDYNRSMGPSLGVVLVDTHPDNENYTDKLHEACWRALFNVKDYYKDIGDQENYGLTYVAMGNFIARFGVYPKDWKSKFQKKKFNQQLRHKLGELIISNPKNDKLKKWSRLLKGMMYLNYIKQSPQTQKRNDYLTKAYVEFSEAKKLNTTKTVYLLLAEVIIDYNYVPDGLTRTEATDLAEEYIEKALTTSEGSSKNREKSSVETIMSLGLKYGRPQYMNEMGEPTLLPTNPVENFNQQFNTTFGQLTDDLSGEDDFGIYEGNLVGDNGLSVEVPEECALDDFMLTDDELTNFDYSNLRIPQHQSPQKLSIRQKVINKRGQPYGFYSFNGNNFRLQNVSGQGWRCFFNAIGLNPQEQAEKLLLKANNPKFRYMIANEIVGSIEDSGDIPAEVKQAINYDLYLVQREKLNELNNERSRLLQAQHRDPEKRNPRLLPSVYQNLAELDEQYIEDLRKRASSLQAYQAFIRYHICKEQMMVALTDVPEQGNANLTSADAVVDHNQIGLRVYRRYGDRIQIAHEYIPEDAKEIANVLHEGLHFQALLPIEEEDDKNSVDFNELNDPESIDASDQELPDFRGEDSMDLESLSSFSEELDPVNEEGEAPNEAQMSNLEKDVQSHRIRLTAKDEKFVNKLLEELEILDVKLEDKDEHHFLSIHEDIRQLIDNHYGEGINLYIWVENELPLVFESNDPYPAIVHLIYKNKTWSSSITNRDDIIRSMPDKDELIRFYPKVVTYADQRHFDEHLVRSVLFANDELKLKQPQIAKLIKKNINVVTRIICSNGKSTIGVDHSEFYEALAHANLELLQDINSNKITFNEIARVVGKQYNLSDKQILKTYKSFGKARGATVTPKKTEETVSLYLQGKSFSEIKEIVKLSYRQLIEIVSKKVEPKHYKKTNLKINTNAISTSDRDSLIINTFNELKSKGMGRIIHVKKALGVKAEEGKRKPISRRIISKVLKEKGIYVESKKPSKSTPEVKEKVIKDYKKLNTGKGLVTKAYKTLAKTHGIGIALVRNIIMEFQKANTGN